MRTSTKDGWMDEVMVKEGIQDVKKLLDKLESLTL